MNKVCVKISGLNLSRLINKLIDRGVFVDDLKIKNDYIIFYINENELPKLKLICSEERKHFLIISKSKIRNLICNFKRFYGFALALIIVFCYLFSFNILVCSVTINGVCEEEKVAIEKILSDSGVYVGVNKGNVNVKQIESLLIEKVGNIKGCSIDFKGGGLEINLFPATEKDKTVRTEIKSNYDAIITKIDVKSGESIFKIGDIVKKEDVLIKSDNGAIGNIFGRVCFVSSKIYNENQIIQVPTGKINDEKIFKIGNKIIHKDRKNNTFSNYITEKCVFYILENYFIPLKCEIFRTVEVENIEKYIPFSEVEEQIKKELYNEAILLGVNDLDTITNVSYSVIEENGLFKIDCFIECEINITK